MEKKVSGKVVGFILVIIAALIAIGIFIHYTSNVFTMEMPKRGEKYRFMRYLTCSLVMCEYGCDSTEAISIPLEYDKNGKVILGCNDLIKEKFCDPEGLPKYTKLCGKKYAINFTFDDYVKYVANYSPTITNPGPGIVCGVRKTDRQTDISCLYSWEDNGLIPCPCLRCAKGTVVGMLIRATIIAPPITLAGDVRPEGKLIYNNESCGFLGSSTAGSIWIPKNLGNKCEPKDVGMRTLLDYCEFNKEDTIWIWSNITHSETTTCALSGIPWIGPILSERFGEKCLDTYLMTTASCPEIAICDHKP